MRDFKELFKNYAFLLTKEAVKERVKKIIDEKYEHYDTIATYKTIFSCLELTSLKVTDNEKTALSMAEKINAMDENLPSVDKPAALCVYPALVETLKNTLTEDINITTVVGFPSSQTFLEIKIAETALAIAAGATEIDMVLPVGKFLEQNYDEIYDEIQEIKACCRGAVLKVIIETPALPTLQDVYNATIVAMASGADFVKTSTGKEGATSLYDVYAMCQAIKDFKTSNSEETDKPVGIKIAGGVKTTQDAVLYYTVVNEMLGEAYNSADNFRIGASSLANNLIHSIEKTEEDYF